MANSVERRCDERVQNAKYLDKKQNVQRSLIIDISAGGAGLLILKDKKGISGNICIKILSPELSNLNDFNVNADVIWTDEKYSDDYNKTGLKFLNTDEEINKNISQAINWLGKKDHYFLRCEITHP